MSHPLPTSHPGTALAVPQPNGSAAPPPPPREVPFVAVVYAGARPPDAASAWDGIGPPPPICYGPDAPRFTRFLTLAEQVESVLRYRGEWGPDGERRLREVLTDLSDPAEGGLPELLDKGRLRHSLAVTDDVLWRIGLAQQLVALPDERGLKDQAPRPSVLALSAKEEPSGREWRVLEHLGRYLHGWSRRVGPVRLLVSGGFPAGRYADRVGDGDDDGRGGTGYASPPWGPVGGRWGWAFWMVRKEAWWQRGRVARWGWLAVSGLVGFVGQVAWPAAGQSVSAGALLVLWVVGLGLLGLLALLGALSPWPAENLLGTAEQHFDHRAILLWVHARALTAAVQVSAASPLGAALAAALDGSPARAPDIAWGRGLVVAAAAGATAFFSSSNISVREFVRRIFVWCYARVGRTL